MREVNEKEAEWMLVETDSKVGKDNEGRSGGRRRGKRRQEEGHVEDGNRMEPLQTTTYQCTTRNEKKKVC